MPKKNKKIKKGGRPDTNLTRDTQNCKTLFLPPMEGQKMPFTLKVSGREAIPPSNSPKDRLKNVQPLTIEEQKHL